MSIANDNASLPDELSYCAVSTDAAVFILEKQEGATYRRDADRILKILLIRRAIPPYQGCWALPGGFLRKDEKIRDCALREIAEETGIAPAALVPVGVFDEAFRDPRGRVISHAFAAVLSEEPGELVGGGDADDVRWFDIRLEKAVSDSQDATWILELRNTDNEIRCPLTHIESHYRESWYEISENTEPIAFDHAKIIAEAMTVLRTIAKQPDVVLDLLPEYFTLSALQQVQETITGVPVAAANFRRKMADYVQETEKFAMGVGHRPARLYTRK